jgi:hypothetical protein
MVVFFFLSVRGDGSKEKSKVLESVFSSGVAWVAAASHGVDKNRIMGRRGCGRRTAGI